MINKGFDLNLSINYLGRFVVIILTSILAMMIGFSLVLYTLPSLLLLIVIISIIRVKYKKSQEAEMIKKLQPYVNNFIDSYFKINSKRINKTHSFPKSINSLQYLLKKEEIKIQDDKLLSLIFNKLLLRFIETNLDYSFRSNLDHIPEDKINSLHYILDKLKIQINKRKLHKKVKVAYLKRREKDFNKFFLKNNQQLPDNPTIQQWSKAYVDTFENNTEYIDLLEKLVFSKSLNLEQNELEKEIKDEIERITIKRNAKKVYQAMASQKSSLVSLTLSHIDEMSGEEFERFLQLLFEKRGYYVNHIGGSGDQGADLILKKFNITTVVQAKRHKNTIDNTAIQEVVAAKSYYQCQKTRVVTNNIFTLGAKELARANNVELWDRKRLQEALKYTPIYLDELNLR